MKVHFKLGPERPRVIGFVKDVGRIGLLGQCEDAFDGGLSKTTTEDRVVMYGVQVQLVMGEHRTEWGILIQVKLGRLSATTATGNNAIDEDVDEQPVQDLALNVDNMFQADDCDAYDSGVDEAPTAQTMFMANLSSADPVYDEASPSYDSDILSEDDVQPSYVVGLHADYTSDSNMTPYDQYVKDNAVIVVQNSTSTVLNDMYVMIDNDLHEPKAQSIFKAPTHTVADNSLNAELAIYKEQVELYERRASDLHITETPEQIFWSQDIVKMKVEALKEQNTRPIKALTVYPPNTPATLVP
ncbi:hypothetical protein Tco_1260517, partial [Tanacetum coccineum]